MRPRNLDELVGQEHILGAGSGLRTAIESGHLHSAILYGPPGSGKTTLARIAAAGADGAFEEESAVNAGKAEIRAVIERARERREGNGRATILFLDEIHRFNKAQQDALLPAVEEGLLTLIGATTENPYFEVNSALLSRCGIYELRPLEPAQVQALLRRALSDPERGIADPPAVEEAALEMLAHRSGGDARVALSALERAVERAGRGPIDVAAVEDALQRKAVDYDRQGDRHYDFISAWIKATRGSDVDASLYYLAAMLEGGEDPRFIARRMVILASEDVGNADPRRCSSPMPPPAPSTGSASPSARSTSPRPASTSPSRRSRTPPTRPSQRPGRRCGQTAPGLRPTICATPITPGRRSSAAGTATATRTTSPTASATSSCFHRASRTPASTRPPTAASRPSSAAAWSGSGLVSRKINPGATSQIPPGFKGGFPS